VSFDTRFSFLSEIKLEARVSGTVINYVCDKIVVFWRSVFLFG
jgi:hypothetical protein